MEDTYLTEDARTRLVLSGLNELCEHGVRDFSLRRVAVAAQVSCAAPYKHFKSKEELIGAIVDYIAEKWQLLCHQIQTAITNDTVRLISELCIASIRFWLANGRFRTVLLADSNGKSAGFFYKLSDFDTPIMNEIEKYFSEKGLGESEIFKKQYTIRSLIYGAVLLNTHTSTEGVELALAVTREKIEKEFKI